MRFVIFEAIRRSGWLRANPFVRPSRTVFAAAFVASSACGLSPAPDSAEGVGLESRFPASTHVFVGELLEIREGLSEPLGFSVPGVEGKPPVPLEWSGVVALRFSVKERLKGQGISNLETTKLGGAANVLPLDEAAKALVRRLEARRGDYIFDLAGLRTGRRYLVFAERIEANGSSFLVMGPGDHFPADACLEEILIMREIRDSPFALEVSEARELVERRRKVDETRELDGWKRQEERLREILRKPDLTERKKSLEALVRELGYEELWTFGKVWSERPPEPRNLKERIWHDASQEIEKIGMTLEARKRKAAVQP